MNRYLHYLVLLNMLSNSFVFTSLIFIQNRYDGAVMGLFLGAIIGSCLLFFFSLSINRFPKWGLPEILESTPKWFKFLFLLIFVSIWFTAGAASLLSFNNVTIRYLNPDISGINMILVFSVFIIIVVANLPTAKILYLLEIIVIFNIPFFLIVMYKAYINPYLNWYSIAEVGTSFHHFPSWSVLSAASYVFSGYANMVIFNRVFKEKINIKRLWILPPIGLFNLVTTFAIPIGFHGADGVGALTYPWIVTADSLRMEHAPIERVTSIFLLIFITISLVSVIVHWHVALELLKSTFKFSSNFKSQRAKSFFTWGVLFAFAAIILILEKHFKEEDIKTLGKVWLQVRLPGEVLLVLVLLFLVWRKKNG